MAGRHRDRVTPLTVVTGIAGALLGIIVGYMLGVSQVGAGSTPLAAAAVQSAPAAAAGTDQDMQAYRNELAADPKNLRANIELANSLYDLGRYADAIPYYQQAFVLDPRNINVSTDLGTSLYYAGRPDDALAQFDRSLALDPTHARTLFNVGIVRRDAKNDARGAVEAWERLLAGVPDYPDAAKVRTMLAELKQKTQS
jgi:cytochrome c-type biogenesis protein CcmH/NrfG